jgi:hypothetical protein
MTAVKTEIGAQDRANGVAVQKIPGYDEVELQRFLEELGGVVAALPTPAPVAAEYITGSANATLTNERVLTTSTYIDWDLTVSGQVKANIVEPGLVAIAGLAKSDGNIIVGDGTTWVAESAGTARTSLGLGTTDTPQFTGVHIQATDTTITRFGAGDISVEGNRVYRSGGADVAVADGGTGASSASAAATNLGLGTGDSPQFNGLNLGATDTTITRSSAGVIAVEGVVIPSISSANILTNKTIAFGSNTVSGTLAEFNTAVTDANLVSIAGVETLTNKTLTSPTINTAPLVGVNATADATNKLSVNSDAVLFNHNGTTSQVKVNKNATANTASHIFQVGFSGRAEFGLIASDDFEMKTSPDGSAFTTGLSIAAADAAVMIPVRLEIQNTDTSITRSAAGIIAVEGVAVPTISSTHTLTNKTIALGSNTVSGTTAQFNAALSDGDFATLAGSETLTNKVLTNPEIGASYLQAAEIATPSSPAANALRIYAKDDSGTTKLATLDSAGTETLLGSGGGGGGITAGTAQATTSGTTFDFASIPAGVSRITILFDGVSLSGTNDFLVQIGDSGGLETSGYVSASGIITGTNTTTATNSTAGFIVRGNDGNRTFHGHMIITRVTGNSWVASHSMGTVTSGSVSGGGSKALSAELDRVRIAASGINTFDAGQVNIFYE